MGALMCECVCDFFSYYILSAIKKTTASCCSMYIEIWCKAIIASYIFSKLYAM